MKNNNMQKWWSKISNIKHEKNDKKRQEADFKTNTAEKWMWELY